MKLFCSILIVSEPVRSILPKALVAREQLFLLLLAILFWKLIRISLSRCQVRSFSKIQSIWNKPPTTPFWPPRAIHQLLFRYLKFLACFDSNRSFEYPSGSKRPTRPTTTLMFNFTDDILFFPPIDLFQYLTRSDPGMILFKIALMELLLFQKSVPLFFLINAIHQRGNLVFSPIWKLVYANLVRGVFWLVLNKEQILHENIFPQIEFFRWNILLSKLRQERLEFCVLRMLERQRRSQGVFEDFQETRDGQRYREREKKEVLKFIHF